MPAWAFDIIVEKGQKGVANTIQRNEKGEIEELEGWHYGEEED